MEYRKVEESLRAVFKRVFRREFAGSDITVEDVEEWDSLSHIQLIIDIESEFDIAVDPDDIPMLYSSFSVIVDYLTKHVDGE